jgi:hypothetical protein
MPSVQSPAIARRQAPLQTHRFSESIYSILLLRLLYPAMKLSSTFHKDCCTRLPCYILKHASLMSAPDFGRTNFSLSFATFSNTPYVVFDDVQTKCLPCLLVKRTLVDSGIVVVTFNPL